LAASGTRGSFAGWRPLRVYGPADPRSTRPTGSRHPARGRSQNWS
jgi:hypothetical protein